MSLASYLSAGPRLTLDDVKPGAQALADRTGYPAHIYRIKPGAYVCTTEEPLRKEPILTLHPRRKK